MIAVYNCDERYAEVFAVSVLSLFECNKEIEELTVYLIDNGITSDSMQGIQKIAMAYHRKIIAVPMPDIETLVGMNVAIPAKSNRIATCGRLFVASLLPEDIDKVIYFDCDTLFLHSIKELWDIDLEENYAGMMADVMSPNYRTMLGIPADGIYYNSGVALINMKLWRDNDIEKAFMYYLQSQGGYIPWPDQGIFNAVLDGRIVCLPCKYNVHSALFSFPYNILLKVKKPQWFYTKEEFENALKNPAMVHFTTTFSIPRRPWYKECNHPYTDSFLKYRKMTPWRDAPLWEDDRSLGNRMLYSSYARYAENAPQWLYIWTSKLYYVYFQPLMFKLKKRKHMQKYQLKNRK